MKILLLHQYYLGEGEAGGSRWNEITRMWADAGHEITVLAGMVHYTKGKKKEEYKGKYVVVEQPHSRIRLIRSHVSEAYNVNFLGRLWAYFSFAFSASWAGITKATDKYDVIVATSPPLFIGIPTFILSKIKRIPYVFEIRDLWPESAIDTGVLQSKWVIKFAYWFEQLMYNHAALINVLTPAFRETLITNKQVSPEKILFIPNAADFSLSEELLQSFDAKAFREAHGLENKFVITYVGAHGVANHLEQVLETAQLLTDTHVLFLLIGDGMQKDWLKSLAKEMKLENVRFIDSVPKQEVFKYILASDMGASVLKKNDTFKTVYSNKTFDYMSCKKPILMAIDGVSKQLVEDAKAGVFVEPENPKDFALKIRSYLANPEKVTQQGGNGYHYAKEHFDREALAVKYLEALQQLVNRR